MTRQHLATISRWCLRGCRCHRHGMRA